MSVIVQGPAAAAAPSPPAATSSSTQTAAVPAAPPPSFDIWEIDVDGNTVLDEMTIDKAIVPFLGPDRSTKDVDGARAALEQTYRERGYKIVTVVIPRQTVRDGIVRLQVLEGQVEHLDVVGSKYHSLDRIKSEAPSMAEGQVLNFDAMKKDLVKLNGQADRRVTPALKAGKQPGTVDVDLAVDDSLPLHGSLELNDRRSQDTSELRLLASLSYDNLWQLGHSLTVSYQTAPQNQSDARVLFASYLARFAGSPYSVLVNGIKSDSNVSTVGGTDVIGNGTTVGLEGIAQLPGSDVFYDTLMFGVDYKHVRNVVGVGQDSFETPVTYYPFTLGYTGVWRKPEFTTQLDLSAHFAVSEFGSRVEELQLNRSNAHGQQAYLRGGLSHTQTLWRGMEGYVHVAGQWSDEPLLTTEQFSIGGADTVRGYLEAEALGDNGYYANVELRSPSFADDLGFGGTKPFQDLRMVAFYDSGQVDLRMATPEQTPRFLLGSFGAGVNMKLLSHVNGSLYWAEPYLSGPATAHWQSRILFRVSSYF